jgi:Icc-related predicted phosphoesterase
MRIVLISDTHGLHDHMPPVPDGDVLIHAGDFTNVGEDSDVLRFDRWLGTLPHKHKLVIAGNHERGWDQPGKYLGRDLSNAYYLQDSSINIDGKNFYGSPWTPSFGYGWAFNADRDIESQKTGRTLIKEYWSGIPDAGLVDVLITHGPPRGIGDQSAPEYGGEHVGCDDLARQVEISQPYIHVFGHIHGGYGRTVHKNTVYYNASTCDEAYRPVHKPWVVELT